MIVVFIVDGNFDNLYFTTPEKYSLILDKHNITPDRVQFRTVSMETLLLIQDKELEYAVR